MFSLIFPDYGSFCDNKKTEGDVGTSRQCTDCLNTIIDWQLQEFDNSFNEERIIC
jgi:hypothetical protein